MYRINIMESGRCGLDKHRKSKGVGTIDIKAENEEKKEYLWGYQRGKQELNRLEEELAELRLNKMCPSVKLDGMPHAPGKSDLSRYMVQVDKLERKIQKASHKRIRKLKEIRDRIERLEDENEKDVLMYRYIRGIKWDDIAIKMGYSERRIHYIHNTALEKFVLPEKSA